MQEWFYRNVEQFDYQVHEWTLEMVVQGLHRRFLHTLTHHHVSNRFDTVSQGNKTVQEVVRALARPDLFPFCSPFSLYGLPYCMPELTLLISYCALS